MASEIPKQYLPLHGRRVIEHSLDRLLSHPRIEAVYVALSPNDAWWASTVYANTPRVIRINGAAERCHSVLNALELLYQHADPLDWVLVHDAARPCLSNEDLERLICMLENDPVGGLLGVPVHDTMKRVDESGRVEATLPRDRLWHAYTPQMFRLGALRTALRAALEQGLLVTDDASAMELAGYQPKMIEGHADNIKITRPADLALAEFYLARQSPP
jgi:2-C-methyl-D-erythritol 4-phosphate cytidylyltransferase